MAFYGSFVESLFGSNLSTCSSSFIRQFVLFSWMAFSILSGANYSLFFGVVPVCILGVCSKRVWACAIRHLRDGLVGGDWVGDLRFGRE